MEGCGVANPFAPSGSAPRYLPQSIIDRINSVELAPTEKPDLDAITDAMRPPVSYEELIYARRIRLIISLIPEERRSQAQKDWIFAYRVPLWYSDSQRLNKKPGNRRKSKATTAPAPPALNAGVQAWISYLDADKKFRPRGLDWSSETKTREAVEGYLIIRQLAPLKIASKEEARRIRNMPIRVICEYFAQDSSKYLARVTGLGGVIAATWAPTPFPTPANITADAFVRHAAECGLTPEMAEGAVHAFASGWVLAANEASMVIAVD